MGYTEDITALNPLSYWRLRESSGSTVVAEAGSNGSYSGTPAYISDDGPLNGSPGCVGLSGGSFANITWPTISNYPFSICGWIKANVDNKDHAVLTASTSNVTDSDLTLLWWNVVADSVSKTFTVLHGNAAGNTRQDGPANAATTGSWQFVVGVFPTATSRKLYIDGVLAGSNNGDAADLPSGLAGRIGSWSLSASLDANARLAEVSIFGSDISNSVADLYAAALSPQTGGPAPSTLLQRRRVNYYANQINTLRGSY